MIEVAPHQVGAPQVDLLLVAVLEIIDTTVLEKPSDDARHSNIFAHSGDARPQAADPPDQQVDLPPRLRGLVEKTDHGRLLQAVHLEDQPCWSTTPGVLDLPLDQLC